MGTTGWTMFNTVQVPNDSQYPNGGCRDGGTPGQFPNDGFSYGASSAHPGGANVLFGDGSVQVRQELDQLPDLVGPGDQERRRSDQR